jgi:hypothetical protein
MKGLEIFLSWQTAVLVVAVFGITQLVKTILDASIGHMRRKDNIWLSRVLMPSVPVVIGGLFGAFVPLYPEILVEYVNQHIEASPLVVHAAWGAVCGSQTDYLYSKVKDFLKKK